MIQSSDKTSIAPYLSGIPIPKMKSHKGQNGKVLVIGGSSLFHAASLWAAETASHFVDMVHYASTAENNSNIVYLKQQFANGIVIPRSLIHLYAAEDNVICVGPGMVRGDSPESWETRKIVHQLIEQFPHKQFVFDAGALQMMDKKMILTLTMPPVLTPHIQEFSTLFGISVADKTIEEREKIVSETAKQYRAIILLKAIEDTISNGEQTVTVTGGNAGLTKGGTGDVLAGLVSSLSTGKKPFESAICGSWLIKTAADQLFQSQGYWYSTSDILTQLPATVHDAV